MGWGMVTVFKFIGGSMKICQSLKNFFFKPSKKLGLGILLVLGAIVGIIAKVSFDTTLHHTSQEKFCVSCHTMEWNEQTLMQTPHGHNQFGVTADCAACHLPHDAIPMYIRKVQALNEVYETITGKYDKPGSFDAERYRMAQKEWARMEANGSAECKACHRYDRMDFDKMPYKARVAMKAAAAKDQSCIDCHKGIAHPIPKPPKGANNGIDPNLVASSLTANKVYYTQVQTPIYATDALKTQIGYLEGISPVTYIKSSGNADLVELNMWRKEKGFGRIWYNDFAKSIMDAALTKEFMQSNPKYQSIETKVDPLTGITWQKVKMQVWIHQGQLTADIAPIWAHAKDMFQTSCSVCHKQPDVKHFDSNTWVGVFNGMKGFTSLTPVQAKQVLRYLQMHASDAASETSK